MAFVVHPDGSDDHQIEQDAAPWTLAPWSAAWSPDSKHLAIAAERRILVVSAAGADRRELAAGYYPSALAWSPDSATLAFVGSEPGSEARSVFIVAAGGGVPRSDCVVLVLRRPLVHVVVG